VTLLDRFLPSWDVRETHGIRIDAPSERILEAVREATPAEAPLLRALFALRGLPTGAGAPIWTQMVGRAGFAELGEEPGRELVAGAIGRPWNLIEGLRRDFDFEAFDEPGYAKMALGFHAADGVLTTETRVLLTDDEARRRFARYWRVVGPLSSLTRRSWLAAAKERAEKSSHRVDEGR
jgi:hypothetical protein